MSQLSNHLVAERLAFVGCQSQMVPKLLFLWRWFRGCAPHNLHRTVAWDCCLGEARWWKMGHETTLGCLKKKQRRKKHQHESFHQNKKKVQVTGLESHLSPIYISQKNNKKCFVNWKKSHLRMDPLDSHPRDPWPMWTRWYILIDISKPAQSIRLQTPSTTR